jgi:hypothetical protein
MKYIVKKIGDDEQLCSLITVYIIQGNNLSSNAHFMITTL